MKPNRSQSKGALWETIGIIGGVLFFVVILPIAFFVVSGGAVSQEPEVLSVAGVLVVVGFIVLIRYMGAPNASLRRRSGLMEGLFRILPWVVFAFALGMGIYLSFTTV